MKINAKISAAAGVLLFAVAAFISVSLMTAFLGAGTQVPGFLTGTGAFLRGAYGFSSWLIPVFFLAAGILFMLPEWTERRGAYLAVSVFPFFTVVMAEKFCAAIAADPYLPLLSVKMGAVLAAAALVIAIEYILTGLLCDVLLIKTEPGTKERLQFSADELSDELALAGQLTEEEIAALSAINSPAADPALDDEEFSPYGTAADFFGDEETPLAGKPEDTGVPACPENSAAPASQPTGAPVEEENCLPPAATAGEQFSAAAQNEAAAAEPAVLAGPSEPETAKLAEPEDNEAPDENPVLFVDLNWKEHKNPPVRVFDDAQKTFEAEEDANPEDADDDEDEEAVSVFDEEEQALAEELYEQNAASYGLAGRPGSRGADFPENEDDFDDDVFPEIASEEAAEEENCAYGAKPLSGRDLTADVFTAEAAEPAQKPAPLKRSVYRVPSDGLLNSYPDGEYWIIDSETQRAASILKETLSEFKIEAEVTGIRKGPVITMFEILPAPGVKLTRIVALQDNIALRLAASSVRIVAPIPGKHAVGIEVPNKERFIVSFRELIDNDVPGFKKMEIPVVLGKDITGEAQILDLAATPHLLIAGSTGSGKSVCVNSMILSVLYKRSPQEVKMILIDPKIVELKLYNDIPHLLTPVITEPKKAFQALQYCLCEMERRYSMLDKMGVRDIKSYNRRITERNLANEKLPYIVVIIDEFADLMATTGKELESTVARLAAMSRAVGVHLVLATQRPSIDVITGLIKANIPTRIAFMVASKMDSRIIIDQVGAEKLLGKGDMLYSSAVDPFPARIQGTYVSEEEVERVVEYVKQYGEPEYIDEEIFFDDEEEPAEPSLFGGEDDPLYDKALEIVLQAGKASASYIQRRLKIGYNRAARLVENMEERGIVGPANGSKPREVVHVPR